TVVLETVARAIAVGLPVAVGLVAWRRPPFERFGRLLVVTGAAVLAVTLSLSDSALPYSTGRVASWAVLLLVAVFYAPTALLVETYPTPAPWVTCASACPVNAFMVVAHEPPVIA